MTVRQVEDLVSFPVLFVMILAMTGQATRAADGTLPLKTSVKVIAPPVADETETDEAKMNRREAPKPTTPGGKLPQYQLDHNRRRIPSESQLSDPRLRFFLRTRNSIALVEMTITIDGKPFQMAREQRVAKILSEAAKEPPISTTNEPAGVNSDTVLNRIRQTAKVTGQTPTANEVRWLLTNWIDGPTVLMLNDNFQRFRAAQQPEVVILDRNSDGSISTEEMKLAMQSLLECDRNRDGIIQFTEIPETANERDAQTRVDPGKLITLLPDASTAAAAYQRLAAEPGIGTSPTAGSDASPAILSRLDLNGDGRFDDQELQSLNTMAADLSFRIEFHSRDPAKSCFALDATSPQFSEAASHGTVDTMGITLDLGKCPVTFQAVQQGAGDQISIGAVKDGYPLLPALDPNDDGRLTLRELRGLFRTLRALDQNGNGVLSQNELQAPIRICIGLGPVIHGELAGLRSVPRKGRSAPTEGPEWFVRMDRNKDNDLTRSEFPGTDEQFATLDTDHDELISSDEALAFDKQTSEH